MLLVSIFTNTRAFDKTLWTGNCNSVKYKPVSVSAKNNNDFGHKDVQLFILYQCRRRQTVLTVRNFSVVLCRWRWVINLQDNYSKQIFRVNLIGKRFNGAEGLAVDGFWHHRYTRYDMGAVMTLQVTRFMCFAESKRSAVPRQSWIKLLSLWRGSEEGTAIAMIYHQVQMWRWGRRTKAENVNGKLGLGSVLFSSWSSTIGLTYSGAVNCVQVEIIWLLIEFRDSHSQSQVEQHGMINV